MTIRVLLLVVLLASVVSVVPADDAFVLSADLPEQPTRDLTTRDLPWYYSCKVFCLHPISWDNVTSVCRSDGSTMHNKYCATSTQVDCEIAAHGPLFPAHPQTAVFEHPGKCGAPNYCYEWLGRGTPGPGACECTAGWQGVDCSQVQCLAYGQSNDPQCNGRGECVSRGGLDTCVCAPGFSGRTCEVDMSQGTPAVPQLTAHSQYEDDAYGDQHPLFNESAVARIYIELAPADLTFIMNATNQYSKEYLKASFRFENGAVSASYPEVGFRAKGFASRSFMKKSFKVDLFKKNKQDVPLFGQSKLAFKAMGMTPSFMREKLSQSMYDAMGAKIQRMSYAQFFVNGIHFGFYVMMEDPSEPFLQSRFGNSDGALYKSQGDLRYYGSDPSIYQHMNFSGILAYKPRTPAAENYTALAHFITVLNLTPEKNFVEEIEKVFDTDLFLRAYAVSVLSGNWDGIYNGNNYFLYLDPSDGLFKFFRQDLDMSFGAGNSTKYNFNERNIWTWTTKPTVGRGFMLPTRILQQETYQRKFAYYINLLLSKYFSLTDASSLFKQRFDWMYQLVDQPLREDYFHHMDLAWSYDQARSNPFHTVVHVNPLNATQSSVYVGIEEYVKLRTDSAVQQLQSPPYNSAA